MLEGVPRDNRVLLCVKAALADPQLVDEYLVLISKKTGIPQFSVTLQTLEQAIEILKSSKVFWPKIRTMGIGLKGKGAVGSKPARRPRAASPSSSSSSSSDSDSSSSDSSSSGSVGGLDLGFSEDEAKEVPKRPVARPKTAKKKQQQVEQSSDDSSSSDSSSSESSSSSSESEQEEVSPRPQDERMESSPSSPKRVDEPKKSLDKKLADLAARRRAEQAAAAEETSASGKRKLRQPYNVGMKENVPDQPAKKPRNPPTVDIDTTRKVSVEPRPDATEAKQSTEKVSAEVPKQARKDVNPPQTGANPPQTGEPKHVTKEPRIDSPQPVVPPPTAKADWNTDFGRLVRQAIDNRKLCPFRTLGLGPTSSMAEVKKRWAKLCLLLHPDKAPGEWKTVPELVDANQAINEAKRAIEQRFQAVALVRPQRPSNHAQPFTLDKGTFGKRRVEIRWHPSPVTNPREKVERYLVFIIHGGDPRRRDQMFNAGSVKEGTDPFFVIVEDDQRFARFFAQSSLTVSILASNAAGNSDPLTVLVPLR